MVPKNVDFSIEKQGQIWYSRNIEGTIAHKGLTSKRIA
jgi:hypothetical protein